MKKKLLEISRNDLTKVAHIHNTTAAVDLAVMENQHVHEWINQYPEEILCEDLLIIANRHRTFTNKEVDFIALDKSGNTVIIEVKRDADRGVLGQAISYVPAVMLLGWDEIIEMYSAYKNISVDNAIIDILTFLQLETNTDYENISINDDQHIRLLCVDFHDDVIAAVDWFNNKNIDIKCLKYNLFQYNANNSIFLESNILFPFPEYSGVLSQDIRKDAQKSSISRKTRSVWNTVPGNYENEQIMDHFEDWFKKTTPNKKKAMEVFCKVLLRKEGVLTQEELIAELRNEFSKKEITDKPGTTASNLSQDLTNKNCDWMLQVFDFQAYHRNSPDNLVDKSVASSGYFKTDYQINQGYQDLVEDFVEVMEEDRCH